MGKDKKWYRKQDSKELICTTHEHKLRCRECWWVGKAKVTKVFKKMVWRFCRLTGWSPRPRPGDSWKEVFDIMKGKDQHPRLLYPATLSFKIEGQIKCSQIRSSSRSSSSPSHYYMNIRGIY